MTDSLDDYVFVDNEPAEDCMHEFLTNKSDIAHYILGEIQKINHGCSLSIITRRLKSFIKPDEVRRVVEERKDMFELLPVRGSHEPEVWVVG